MKKIELKHNSSLSWQKTRRKHDERQFPVFQTERQKDKGDGVTETDRQIITGEETTNLHLEAFFLTFG